MANKSVGKTSKKAAANFNWDVKKPNKKTSKKAEKAIKKLGTGVLLGAVLLLAIGAVGGYFGFKVLIFSFKVLILSFLYQDHWTETPCISASDHKQKSFFL